MNSNDRNFTPAAAPAPARNRRRLIAAAVACVFVLGAVSLAALWYLRLCTNCGPILCDDPCSLPTFSRIGEPLHLS